MALMGITIHGALPRKSVDARGKKERKENGKGEGTFECKPHTFSSTLILKAGVSPPHPISTSQVVSQTEKTHGCGRETAFVRHVALRNTLLSAPVERICSFQNHGGCKTAAFAYIPVCINQSLLSHEKFLIRDHGTEQSH